MNDSELLKRYVEKGSQEAFSELTQRHVNLVFSAALRQVGGDRQLAEDVTQTVFTDLARKAASLAKHELLSGWLYTSARFAACKAVRTETRRRAREEKAIDMLESFEEAGVNWQELEPVLDEAMHELEAGDRHAILLRYFEGRPLAEVGSRLGLTADAARMRVERAIGKLRKSLRGRGVTAGSAALAAILAQQATTAAPVGLGVSVAGAALASVGGAAATGGATATVLELITMSKIKAAVAVALVAGMSVPLVVQHRAHETLAESNRGVLQKLAATENQMATLAQDNTRLSNLVAQTAEANRGNEEVIRLRAEVAKLRSENRGTAPVTARERAGDPLQETLQTIGARASQLKARMEQSPEKWIPEMALLKDRNWLDAVGSLEKLETDEDYRRAMNQLRIQAKSEFGGKLQSALKKFADANDGMLPTDLSQLRSYLEQPIDAAMLQRYKLAKAGRLDDVPRGESIVDEVAPPVDDEHDTYFRFHRNGTSSTSYSQIGTEIQNAATEYAQANNGILPRQPGDLATYLKHPISNDRVKQFLDRIPPNVTTLEQLQNQR